MPEASMIADNDFDRLVALGRRKGRLDIDDIKGTMSVEAMTTEDVAGLVILLEEHGIAIDLDPELLVPRNGPPPLAAKPLFIPSGDKASFDAPTRLGQAAGPVAADVPHGEAEPDGFPIDGFVYAMAIGLVLFLLAWAAWGSILG
jgi:hypothetical protein